MRSVPLIHQLHSLIDSGTAVIGQLFQQLLPAGRNEGEMKIGRTMIGFDVRVHSGEGIGHGNITV